MPICSVDNPYRLISGTFLYYKYSRGILIPFTPCRIGNLFSVNDIIDLYDKPDNVIGPTCYKEKYPYNN